MKRKSLHTKSNHDVVYAWGRPKVMSHSGKAQVTLMFPPAKQQSACLDIWLRWRKMARPAKTLSSQVGSSSGALVTARIPSQRNSTTPSPLWQHKTLNSVSVARAFLSRRKNVSRAFLAASPPHIATSLPLVSPSSLSLPPFPLTSVNLCADWQRCWGTQTHNVGHVGC